MMATEYFVPDEQVFENGDWHEAKDLREVGDALIERHEELAHLMEMNVVFYWKRTGGASGGNPVMGKCRKVSGDLKAFAPGADFLVWLAADHCRNEQVTDHQVRAYVFHELLHAGVNEKGRPVMRNHDWTGFDAELREFGLYDRYLQAAGAAFQQLRLEA